MRQRIVTMCQGGEVRSVALKRLLGRGLGRDVIACGWEVNTLATREMLFAWADTIIILQSNMEEHVPEKYHNNPDGTRRLFCYDVGPDIWSSSHHPDLIARLIKMIEDSRHLWVQLSVEVP